MAAPKLATRQPLPFQLSLRIRHPSIDPEEISKGLGIEPEHTFRAGQPAIRKVASRQLRFTGLICRALTPGDIHRRQKISFTMETKASKPEKD